jgi:hypothetical protein
MISVLYADNEEGLPEPGKLCLDKSGQSGVNPIATATEAPDCRVIAINKEIE